MENSLLSRLPAQLRISIYELVLLHDDKHTISKSGRKDFDSEYKISSDEVRISDDDGRTWRPRALLSCCRQIRREASSIYYAGIIFSLTWDAYDHEEGVACPTQEHLRSWLQTLEAADRAQIRRIGLSDGSFRFEDQVEEQIQVDRAWLEEAGVILGQAKLFVVSVSCESKNEGEITTAIIDKITRVKA